MHVFWQIEHKDLEEKNGTYGNGGLSVHYSHALQLLFFSYLCGSNFAASLDASKESIAKLFSIDYKVNVPCGLVVCYASVSRSAWIGSPPPHL